MNKVFKVIWSDARSAYVVVSEIAKNHGSKSCSTKKLLAMLIAAGVMTCASVAPAMAAPTVDDSAKVNVGKKAEVAVADNAKVNVDEKIAIGIGANAKGAYSVAIGNNAVVTGLGGVAVGHNSEGAENSVALGSNVKAAGFNSVGIGNSAKTSDLHSIAIGYNSESSKASAIAIGNEAKATNQNSFAFGQKANASGESSVAFGNGSKATHLIAIAIGSGAEATDEETIAIGGSAKATSQYSVAIGNHIDNTGEKAVAIGQQTMAYGNHSTAVGAQSQAKYTGATAIGTFAKATQEGSIALGYNSHADRGAGIKGYDPLTGKESTLTSLAWKSGKGALSIGNAGGTRQIINVAAGSQDTDAVNVAQLKAATENAGWNLSTGKEITNPTKVKSGAIVDFSGDDENITVSKEETDFATLVNVKLNRNLDVDSVHAGDYFMNNEKGIGFGGEAYITPNGLNANDKVITNVAAGVADTDAVNVSQLKNSAWKLAANGVLTEAEDVKAGDYVDFSGDQNVSVSKDAKDGVNTVKVELNKDLVGIESISNGDAKMALNGAAGTAGMINGKGASIYMQDGYTVINSKVAFDQNGKISGVAAGVADTDAVNVSQLKNSAWKLAANGVLTEAEDVKAGDYVDFNGDQNVSVSKDVKDGVKTVKVELNKDLVGIETISNDGASLTLNGTATELTNGKGAAITLFGDTTTINNKVTVYNDGRISGVAAGINDTDAVNVSQLKAVGTTANMGWNLATNGVVTEATNVKPGDFVDFSGDKNISVSKDVKDGVKTVKVELNKDIDVNYVQTNALNAKYNLSVGTANENGTVPFFVNSNGAFYGANGSFVVDKDGKVTATAGEIGNVVLQNGVYTGHSALRDGELFVGDASGNYSQITTKGAKLGKVTVDKAGQIHNVTAGTADEDAVNVSQLNKATASSKTTVSNGTNTTVTSTVAEDGHTDYKVNLNKELEGIESISNGDAKINLNDTGVVISKGNDKTFSITDTGMGMSVIGDDYVERSIMVGKTGTVISGGLSVAGSKITNVAAGTDDTDAVNYGQLKKAVSEGNTDSHIKAGEYEVGADNKVSMDIVDKNGQSTGEKVTIKDVAKASDVGDVSKIDKDIQNIKGNTTVVDAVNNVNNKVGDLNYNQVAKGDLVNGDNTTTAIGKLNQKLSDVEKTAGAHSTVSTDDSENISVTPTKDEKTGATDYKVSLNKDLKLDSVKVGENVSLTKDGLTAGNTKVTNAGLSIGDKTYVSKDGLNANKQTITNVANGKVEKDSTDAVNGGQLYETNQAIANNATNISSLSHSISNLDNRVNKVGAGAAALAALHPLDFDPDAKWDFAAGYGNYRGANAAAVGAYYRPNEDTMFSVGGTFGNGENMVNAGVSFKLGSGSSHVSTSRVAMAKEIKELRGELEAMKSAMLDANAGKKIDTSKLQLFPDVPQNHWAYEYVAQLAGNGMIEGYPDGNFAGDRPMTRYEFAAILYRAMTKGAVLSDKILSEFSHELEYFTVDTIAKDKAGNPTIQRVRTVKENKNK